MKRESFTLCLIAMLNFRDKYFIYGKCIIYKASRDANFVSMAIPPRPIICHVSARTIVLRREKIDRAACCET